MATRVKRMCKWEKEGLDKHFKDFVAMVGTPKYACRKCGRVAQAKKSLCKPVALSD